MTGERGGRRTLRGSGRWVRGIHRAVGAGGSERDERPGVTLHGTAWTNEDDMRMEFSSRRERLDVVSGQLLSHARGRDDDGERRRACPARSVRRQHAVVRFRAETDSSACGRRTRRRWTRPWRGRSGRTASPPVGRSIERVASSSAESARGTDDEPLTGVWMQGIDRADGPADLGACSRFAARSPEQAHAGESFIRQPVRRCELARVLRSHCDALERTVRAVRRRHDRETR